MVSNPFSVTTSHRMGMLALTDSLCIGFSSAFLLLPSSVRRSGGQSGLPQALGTPSRDQPGTLARRSLAGEWVQSRRKKKLHLDFRPRLSSPVVMTI